MPYIQIQAYPKDEEIKNRIAEKINRIFLEEWGCPQEAISLSFEELDPALWAETVENTVMEQNKPLMKIYKGQKKYD